MPINYTQTDTNYTFPGAATLCSGDTFTTGGASEPAKIATNGGTAGSVGTNITLVSSASLDTACIIKCTIDSGTTWAAGTWTWRLNITTSNMNLTLEEVYICRYNSASTPVNQATIGSVTGLAISLGTTGVKSGNITGSAQTPSAGDIVIVSFRFSNGAMSNQTAQATFDQNIDSPFTAQVGTNLLQFCISPQPTR